jgi:hypothetical protein
MYVYTTKALYCLKVTQFFLKCALKVKHIFRCKILFYSLE